MASVQPPCSGCPANARLLTASHASSSSSNDEGAHGDARWPARLLIQWKGDAKLQELSLEDEAAVTGKLVTTGSVQPECHVAAARVADHVDRGGEQEGLQVGRRGRGGEFDDPLLRLVVRDVRIGKRVL